MNLSSLLQAVVVNAEHLAVVVHPDQEVAALGVQEGRNGLERTPG